MVAPHSSAAQASQARPATRRRPRIEQGTKRVRAYFGGQVVADTVRPVLVWESPHYPAYYFPVADVRMDLLTLTGRSTHSAHRGDGHQYTLRVGERVAVDAAWRYLESPIPRLRDLIRFGWEAMDAWFEEDEEVFVHPRSPYTRVDILPSSRLVRVELDGVVLAETTSPRVLFETGLPPRYYLPKTDVRLDLLEPSDALTRCPYKGEAQYFSARINGTLHRDVAWIYRTPLPESERIAGLLSFYDSKAEVFVDGERQGQR